MNAYKALLNTLIFTSTLAITAAANAEKFNFIAADKAPETMLCVKTGENDVSGLKRLIRKEFKRNTRIVANEHRCNGVSLAKFAYAHSAKDTLNYINNYSYSTNKVRGSVEITDAVALHKTAKIKTVYVTSAR